MSNSALQYTSTSCLVALAVLSESVREILTRAYTAMGSDLIALCFTCGQIARSRILAHREPGVLHPKHYGDAIIYPLEC